MRITCPNCDTSYTVPADKIGPKGRTVRCARCGLRWHATQADDAATENSGRDGEAPFRAEAAPGPGVPERPASARIETDRPSPLQPRPERPSPGDLDRPEPDVRPGTDAAPPADETEAEPPASAPVRAAEAEAVGSDLAPVAADPADWPDPASARAPLVPIGAAARPSAGEAASEGDGRVPEPTAKAEGHGDVESLAKRPSIRVKRPQKRRIRLPNLDYRASYTAAKPWIGLALFGLAILLPLATIVMRAAIVEAMPSMAGLYRAIGFEVNLRGLVFQKIETIRELESGQPVLVVEGEISNPTDSARPLPSIRLALRGDDRQEIYAWSVDPKATSVSPGASVRFRTRLAAPPDDARDVQIRFTERRSRQAAHP
ncbi:MJ0042-type zinc finger domain-containing protein [Prosthecodimorpha staleyi]|uniref:Zinc-ribbon domain-containing protein n=1 Tax=Prosthecodimorpha staleyi TaxID=2840188 RepID=A0A947GE88_9HYPH|nr:MJ0042-type zinc finger domain-containing protein [Prosthecodimorpha staleyi]MBT9291111.1 zinc-ribbon domain-containing protein [Prosthecodimorpha staleyi]